MDDELSARQLMVKHFPNIQRAIPGIPSVVDDQFRRYGVHVVAGSGAGKSRWLGRKVVWPDFFRQQPIPTFVFDTGKTIDNFLHELIVIERQAEHKEWVEKFWQKIRYINMAGVDGLVVPLPLLQPLPGEPAAAPAKRLVDTIKRLNPHLATASIMGLPPLEQAANAAGTILTLLGGSVLDMADLVRDPKGWEGKILDNMQAFPQLPKFMAELKDVEQTGSLLTQLSLFTFDDTLSAIYGAKTPALDLQQVIDNREVVLFHFPPYMERRARDFSVRWLFWWIVRFLELRGTEKEPVSLVIDELADLGNFEDSTSQASFAKDLNYLINTFMRGHNVWVTLAHQQMSQFSDTIQSLLFNMRVQIVGRANDRDSARQIGSEMVRYDPYKEKDVKKGVRPVYDQDSFGRYFRSPRTFDNNKLAFDPEGEYEPYDDPRYFAPIEQQYENADMFESLADLMFFRKTPEERMFFSIYHSDNQYAESEPEVLNDVRRKLMQRDGRKIEEVLAEISNPTQNHIGDVAKKVLPSKSPVKKRVPL